MHSYIFRWILFCWDKERFWPMLFINDRGLLLLYQSVFHLENLWFIWCRSPVNIQPIWTSFLLEALKPNLWLQNFTFFCFSEVLYTSSTCSRSKALFTTALDQLTSTKYILQWINEVHVILLLNQYYLHHNIRNDNKVISCDNMNELMYHQKIITLYSLSFLKKTTISMPCR